MSALASVSMSQALGVWGDLVEARHGHASHGDVAEVYAYRLMPHVPTAVLNHGDTPELLRAEQRAASALVLLCQMFVEMYGGTVEIDGEGPALAFIGRRFNHRCHVRVRQ